MSQYVDNALYCLLFQKLLLPASQGNNALPIGTILPYTGDLNKIPHGWFLCDGKDGTPNLTGRFLQGWGSDGYYNRTVGDMLNPGLPNITGAFGNTEETSSISDGAFRRSGTSSGAGPDSSGGFNWYFNASWSNPIYGSSNTVQPRAYVVYFIIKLQ